MEPEEILKRANNPKNIPGIYNYCDRWCERCAFTSRCLNREISLEHEKNLESLDSANDAYWNEVNNIFADTFKLIQHIAEKQGIELSDLDNAKATAMFEEQEKVRKKTKNHPISKSAWHYFLSVDKFLKMEKDFFDEVTIGWNNQLKIGINEENINRAALTTNDAIEIIRWYSPFISAKIQRAINGKLEGEEWQEENGYPKDSDGSAKVAIIAIDRSIAAWGRLQQLFSEKTDEIIEFLFQLDKLRKMIEDFFPAARSFKRPGFDDN